MDGAREAFAGGDFAPLGTATERAPSTRKLQQRRCLRRVIEWTRFPRPAGMYAPLHQYNRPFGRKSLLLSLYLARGMLDC
jgi:hypothetical protein